MKGWQYVIGFVLTVLVMSGCQASGREIPEEQLIDSTAKTLERAYQKNRDLVGMQPSAAGIDFSALKNINPEIYAWLFIPGTSINAPITQSESGDISFYQTHGPDLREDEHGSLYTHFRYSSRHFDELVSVIYGKTMSSVSVLDGIESLYRSVESMRQYQDVYVFTEEAVFRYCVFCSTEFSDVLISGAYRAFKAEDDTAEFLEDVRSYHTLRRQIDGSVSVDPGDRVLVLSKKLSRDEDQRFLILAKLVDSTN